MGRPVEKFQKLWDQYGDKDAMYWSPGMMHPITRDDLEEREELWINSGESDEHGACSFFIYRHYTDSAKAELWKKRGDAKRYRWRPGLRRPEAIA